MPVPNPIENPVGTSSASAVLSSVSGATAGAPVTQFTYTNANGLLGIGTILNTGADPLDCVETVTDAFGNNATVTTSVAAGDNYLLDLQTYFDDAGTAYPPFVSYSLAVGDPGTPTTFDIRFSGLGSV